MNRRTLPTYAAFTLAVLSAVSRPCDSVAAPGDLDITFAGTGQSRITFGHGSSFCNAAAVQADGKLVLAGSAEINGDSEFELVRIGTNNTPDTSFGVGGAVFTPFFDVPTFGDSSAAAVLILGDGKIVTGGYASYDSGGVAYYDFALARYNPDGSLDTNFGSGGKVIADFGGYAGIQSLALQSDGKILAGGHAGPNFALARYDTNGLLDPSFGSGGTALTPVTGGFGAYGIAGLLIEADQKIVAAGAGGGDNSFAVLRYTTNGVLDSTFGINGEVFTPIPGALASLATAIGYQLGNFTVQNPDRIIVAGNAFNNSWHVLAIVRYYLDGSLDTTFGSGGIVTNHFAPGASGAWARSVLVQGQLIQPHKITVAGYSSSGGVVSFAMARFTSAGALDTTFGTGGQVTLPFGAGQYDEANALSLQSGKIVLAGSSVYDTNSDFEMAAARFSSAGVLDTTFGNNGVVIADMPSYYARASGVAMQADGKVVVSGQTSDHTNNLFALARYNADGSLDTAFGQQGRVTTKVGPTNAFANALLLQPDGKIVAAGESYQTYVSSFALARYNPDGSPDFLFGSGGQVVSTIGAAGRNAINALAIQTDGRILAAGYSYNGLTSADDFALARYGTNGALDTSFGTGGKVLTTFAGGQSVANAAAVQPDTKILVAGYARVTSTTNFALLRYNPDGSLDNSFGSFGRVSTSFGAGNLAYAYGLALQPDGKIILAGRVTAGSSSLFALARYTSTGLLDPAFGSAGQLTTHVGLVYDSAQSVNLLPNGKIVVAGYSQQGGEFKYAVLRYNPDGSLDDAFGLGGKVIVSFGDGSDSAFALAIDQVGRAVVAGQSGGFFGVARLASEPFLKIISVTGGAGSSALVIGVGVPEAIHSLWSSPNMAPGSFSTLAPVMTDAAGLWQFSDTNAVGFNRRFYRLSFP